MLSSLDIEFPNFKATWSSKFPLLLNFSDCLQWPSIQTFVVITCLIECTHTSLWSQIILLDPYVFLLSFLREAIGGRENEINFAYFVIFYIVITTHKEILPGGMFSQKHRLSFVFTDVKGPSSFMKNFWKQHFFKGMLGIVFRKPPINVGHSFKITHWTCSNQLL